MLFLRTGYIEVENTGNREAFIAAESRERLTIRHTDRQTVIFPGLFILYKERQRK